MTPMQAGTLLHFRTAAALDCLDEIGWPEYRNALHALVQPLVAVPDRREIRLRRQFSDSPRGAAKKPDDHWSICREEICISPWHAAEADLRQKLRQWPAILRHRLP